MYINKSLTFLEQVIIAVADRKRDHIPYRQSKLTHVLKDSIGGNCNTVMIANIWGESSQLEETVRIFHFLIIRAHKMVNFHDKLITWPFHHNIKATHCHYLCKVTVISDLYAEVWY